MASMFSRILLTLPLLATASIANQFHHEFNKFSNQEIKNFHIVIPKNSKTTEAKVIEYQDLFSKYGEETRAPSLKNAVRKRAR